MAIDYKKLLETMKEDLERDKIYRDKMEKAEKANVKCRKAYLFNLYSSVLQGYRILEDYDGEERVMKKMYELLEEGLKETIIFNMETDTMLYQYENGDILEVDHLMGIAEYKGNISDFYRSLVKNQ